MFRVKVIDYFSSAHRLRGYDGNCENLHGHNWKVEAVLAGESLDNIGLLVDFKVIKVKLKDILKELDHIFLNDHYYFTKINPTSENLAMFIYNKLYESFGSLIDSVVVCESENSSAEYSCH